MRKIWQVKRRNYVINTLYHFLLVLLLLI